MPTGEQQPQQTFAVASGGDDEGEDEIDENMEMPIRENAEEAVASGGNDDGDDKLDENIEMPIRADAEEAVPDLGTYD